MEEDWIPKRPTATHRTVEYNVSEKEIFILSSYRNKKKATGVDAFIQDMKVLCFQSSQIIPSALTSHQHSVIILK